MTGSYLRPGVSRFVALAAVSWRAIARHTPFIARDRSRACAPEQGRADRKDAGRYYWAKRSFIACELRKTRVNCE
jgi:hypothetical protein